MHVVLNRLRPFITGVVIAAASLVGMALPMHGQPSEEKIGFDFTWHAFANDDSTDILELAYQFSNRGITYKREDNGSVQGKLYLRLLLTPVGTGASGGKQFMVDWMNAVGQPQDHDPPSLVFGLRSFALPPGVYAASIYVEDVNNPSRHDTAAFSVTLPEFIADRIKLSDVEIASQAYTSEETENLFYKNSHIIIPNVQRFLEPPLYELNSYVEIYNAEGISSPTFDVVYQIAAPSKSIIYERTYSLPRPEPGGIVRLETMVLDSLPSATYYLVVRAFNGPRRSSRDSVMCASRFSILNRQMDSIARRMVSHDGSMRTSGGDGLIDPFWAGLAEAELDIEFSKARWIATNKEREMWENLHGAEAKSRFLTRFWGDRDDKPETPESEFRIRYYELLAEAKMKFTAPMAQNGWDSDRGRILLTYGKPDAIDRHVQDNNMHPYEIWVYTTSDYEFVFVDKAENGEYTLVHSDAPNEVVRDNWQKEFATVNQDW